MSKQKIINLKERLTWKVNDYFRFDKSLLYLMKTLKKLYVFSIGFDDMYYGYKNPRRFRVCVFQCVYMWVVSLLQLALIASDSIWTRFNGSFLPDDFRAVHLLGVMLFLMISGIKTDILLGEKNYNLGSFKVFHYLMNNVKYKHKLNDLNYRKLAVLSRIIQSFLLHYAGPTIAIVSGITIAGIGIMSNHVFWYIEASLLIPLYLVVATTITSYTCVIYIILTYYKLLFDQMNKSIASVVPNDRRRVITGRKEVRLTHLMNEHNLASHEIHSINLIIRRTAALFFFFASLIKIISLYLIINTKSDWMRMLITNIFVAFFTSGLGLTFLFSLQIKSAHKSLKIVHSMICKHRMRLSFKLKVSY